LREIATGRYPPHRARLDDLDELGFAVVALVEDDAHASDFARRGTGNQHDASIGTRDAEDAVREGIDGHRELFVHRAAG